MMSKLCLNEDDIYISYFLSFQILMLTFTNFSIEQHSNCNYDYLQIHDGPTASQHRIGTMLPNGGTINGTSHQLYLWFHSDESVAHNGFRVNWRSVVPG